MPKGLFLIAVISLFSFDQPKLIKTKVTKDITIAIPQGWRPMDGIDFTQRYPSVRAPLAGYTNEERLVDFSVNISATQWPDKDIDMARQFFKASISSMFDRVEIISEGTHQVHGKKYVYFEFKSRMNGTRQDETLRDPVLRYTYIQYLIEPGRTLVFSFNCPQRQLQDWQETARAMMKEVKVK
ncbi:MAG: hypothetical protein JNM57_02955 [Cyclobacteriaceae bacterium]|nr:hypothetical protein [Cyclobacteriaceae bacterium]